MTPLQTILGKLPTAKKNREGWIACCPAHEDRSPSLSIMEGDGGKVLVKCHAGCTVEAVCAAVGLRLADLMPTANGKPKSSGNGKGKIVAIYDYRDEKKELLMQALRYEPKDFRQRRPKPGGGWEWSVKGVRVVPYRLPDLLAEPSRPVVVCEGEKDCDNLHKIGVLATCNVGGAGKWTDDHSAFLKGRHVIVLPDNDDAGRDHADKVARSLHGIAASVRIVDLPGLPAKGDVSDWLAAGGTKEKLAELAKAVPLWVPTALTTAGATGSIFVPFPTDAIPNPASGFIATAAKALGCDESYVAMPLIVAMASAIGNTRRVRLKDSWCEPCVFWGSMIGESGTLKSPSLELALSFVRDRQSSEYRDFAEEQKQYGQQSLTYEADLAEWKRKGRKNGDPPPDEPDEPVWGQRLAEDTTVEALCGLLEAQPRGLLVARDELSGWINSFDGYKASAGVDAAFWLSSHRAGPTIINRKTGKRLTRIPRASVNLIGGVQPSTLRLALGGRYRDAEGDDDGTAEHIANGLLARLLLTRPPRIAKRWTDDDISAAARRTMASRFDDLFSLTCPTDQNEEWIPVDLPMATEAKRRYIRFYESNAVEQVALGGDLASAWSKLEGYAARFAMLFALVADPDVNHVDADSMERAIAVTHWFSEEAARVYRELGSAGGAGNKQQREKSRLLNWIEQRGGSVTVREVQRACCWIGNAEKAESAIAELVADGRGEWKHSAPGRNGRPVRQFLLTDGTDTDGTTENTEENRGSVSVSGGTESENVFSDGAESLDLQPAGGRVEVAI